MRRERKKDYDGETKEKEIYEDNIKEIMKSIWRRSKEIERDS